MLREIRFIKNNINMSMPGYYISDDAEVYSLNNPRKQNQLIQMVPRYDQSGKLCVELRTAASERKIIRLEKLVASVYVANPKGHPHVLHLDGNQDNCRANNLMWSKCSRCIYDRKFKNRVYAEQVCSMCSEHNKNTEIKEHQLYTAIDKIGLWTLNGAYRKIALMFIVGNSPKYMARNLGITEQGVYKHIGNMRELVNGLPAGKTSTITQTVLTDEQECIVNKISDLFIQLIGKASAQQFTIERSIQVLLVQLEAVAAFGTAKQQLELDTFAQDCWSALKFCNSSCNYKLTAYDS